MLSRNAIQAYMASGLVMAAASFDVEAGTRTIQFDPNNPSASGYTLVFNSQFSGTALDISKWSTGWAWGSGLSTTYPDDEALPANISVKNGAANLVITKRQTPSGRPYGTAAITTYRKFSQAYGYWEAEIEMPAKAHGVWPTFWLLAEDGSWPPEIDIMEWQGNNPTTDYMTLHYSARNLQEQCTYSSATLTGYHKYGMLWTPSSVTWYVDGVQQCSVSTGIPTTPMFIILNNDTGGWDNNVVDSTTVFPVTFKVVYVTVYAAPSNVVSK